MSVTLPIQKIQENQEWRKLNGIYQLLVYTADVNLLGEKTININRNTDPLWLLLDATDMICLETNTEKTKCMFMTCQQNSMQNHNIQKVKNSFENVAMLKYLKIAITDQNCTHKEINSKLNYWLFVTT